MIAVRTFLNTWRQESISTFRPRLYYLHELPHLRKAVGGEVQGRAPSAWEPEQQGSMWKRLGFSHIECHWLDVQNGEKETIIVGAADNLIMNPTKSDQSILRGSSMAWRLCWQTIVDCKWAQHRIGNQVFLTRCCNAKRCREGGTANIK